LNVKLKKKEEKIVLNFVSTKKYKIIFFATTFFGCDHHHQWTMKVNMTKTFQ